MARVAFFKRIKTAVKPYLPKWFINLYSKLYRKWWLHDVRKYYKKMPIQEVFTQVYKQNIWGGTTGEYFSGPGSIDPTIPEYVRTIKNFIRKNGVTKVIDLGCGDFRVGSKLQMLNIKYVGVDIVQDLVKHNQKVFGNAYVSFICMDITEDNLPDADLCLIREVLQHLSNKEITKVLKNVSKYKYVIVTEHQLLSRIHVVPNKDKPHGPDIRLFENSGVYLECPPFNITIAKVLLDVEKKQYAISKGERLRTFLIQNK